MGGVILGLSHFFLHVSPMGELSALSAHELSIGVNVPEALSTEVLKTALQPTPKPTPTPSPQDFRDFVTCSTLSCWHALRTFWNYP